MLINIATGISLLFSLLALSISGLTAYYNVIRTTDNLSMVAATVPELRVKSDAMLEFSSSDVSVTLINSGSRSSAITSFFVSVSQLRPDVRFHGSECLDELPREDRTQVYETGLDGLVIRHKEVTVQRFKLKSKAGAMAFPIAPFNKGAKEFSVVMCFNIDAVTPSDADISNYQIVREWNVTKNSEGAYDVIAAESPNTKKPLLIYSRTGTVFAD